jgi:hypothetical protein
MTEVCVAKEKKIINTFFNASATNASVILVHGAKVINAGPFPVS